MMNITVSMEQHFFEAYCRVVSPKKKKTTHVMCKESLMKSSQADYCDFVPHCENYTFSFCTCTSSDILSIWGKLSP